MNVSLRTVERSLVCALAMSALVLAQVATAQTATESTQAEPVVPGPAPTEGGSLLGCAGEVHTLDPSKFSKDKGYSPYAGRHYPTRPYFGDQHVHTALSGDAIAAGTTLGPEEAVRFARGEQVLSSTDQKVQLGSPLDWIAVSDHSDGMGVVSLIRAGDPEMMKDATLKRWNEMMKSPDPAIRYKVSLELASAQSQKKLPAPLMDPKYAKTVWDQVIATMEKYNEPGRFTTFIAYEWTSNAGGGNNLHRNVIYRDGKDKAEQMLPMTTFQSDNPEYLWKWMDTWEKKTGGKLLAIPHNGNLSNGRMFPMSQFDGSPMTRAWAEERQKREPLFEALQIKGQSESHPSLSPTDEFAVNYELWDKGNLVLVPKTPGMIQYEYVREALKNGLKAEQDLGVNPFKIGMAGGTDTHNGLAADEENNFFGKFPASEPHPDRWNESVSEYGGRVVKFWEGSAAGITGVWATGNTREELWDAMKRRETFATSGPHIAVRFFGGYDFTKADISRTPAAVGYAKGVAMGGDLKAAPAGKAPAFLIAAMKDPNSGNLDRIQVIKGWVDKSGKTQEKIYDVVWSDPAKRQITKGKLTPVGNTVDIATATWTNTIGASELITVWKDPDFDPALSAFYYARVLEIPTPRWTAYDAAYFKVKMDPKVPMVTQERAFTSPIWYTP